MNININQFWRLSLISLILFSLISLLFLPAVTLAEFGITPGKVFVEDLAPGGSGETWLTIVNKNDEEATFTISPRYPDFTEEGYEVLYNPEYFDFEKEITVPAGQTERLLITIAAPEGEPVEEHKCETWVSVGEKTGEMIAVECAVRVLITTTAEMIGLDITSPDTEKPIDWNRVMMFVFMGLSGLLFLILVAYTLRARRQRG